MSYRLHASLGYHLSRAARIQERRLDDGLRPFGLTRTTWCVLLALGNEGLTQPSEIADFIGIDRTATSRALRALEERGLIARQTGAADKRTRAVALTPTGKARLVTATPIAIANNAAMAAKLAPGQEAEVIEHLKVLISGEGALKTL